MKTPNEVVQTPSESKQTEQIRSNEEGYTNTTHVNKQPEPNSAPAKTATSDLAMQEREMMA